MTTIVVGAGLAGLSAAARLRDAGRDVLVLEATAHLGGRTRTLHDRLLHGQPADLGASMIDLGNDLILEICAEHEIPLTPRFSLFAAPDPEGGLSGASMLRNPLVIGGRLVETQRRERIAGEVRAALDADPPAPVETLPGWAGRVGLSPEAAHAFCVQAGLNPTTVPWIARASHVQPPEIGKLCWMLRDGADSVARALAGGLDVRLGEPVRLVARRGRGMVVATDHGEHTADDVIVATSVRATLRIGFDPVLPPWKVNALLRTPMTQGGKVVAQYADGARLLERMGPAILGDGPVAFVWPRPLGPEDTVVLLGLVPDAGNGALEDEERALSALDALLEAATGDRPRRLAGVLQNWVAEEFVGGVVSMPSADPELLLGHHAHGVGGRLHFAGEHTAELWATGMEGALRSGRRAADDVLSRRR